MFHLNEQRIKVVAIFIYFMMTVASGWMFEDGNTTKAILRFFITLASITIQWEGAHLIIRYGRRKFPKLTQVRTRVVYTAIFFFVYAIFIQLISEYVVDNVIDKGSFLNDPARRIIIPLQALTFTLFTIGLFEAFYFYSNYSRSELEKEELLRANLQSQFDSLKGQVNPHFLFNSLNSLSSLIMKDPARAEIFVEEMSNVYRFLLRSNEQELITLKEELDFIQSYLHLLNTRFGDNLKVKINVEENYYSYLLPPLTLQLLVENAVKHNIISRDQPLQLHLFTSSYQRLHVVNNLQKKTREVLSEKVGLSNIISKYKLLRQPEVEIIQTATEFAVIIPLIKAEEYESIHH
ncbi:MAG: histidine kinase [Bacteroidota bacterium]|nr:histidine kinase [Bacteroidota bacterium]